MQKINFKMIALGIFSTVSIAYEIFVMRIFSIGSWSNFGFLVISTALLGFGLAGTLLCFLTKSIKKHPKRWLGITALLFIPAMVSGYVLAQLIPFNPIFLTSDISQILWVAVYYLVYGIPFFVIAMFIGLIFMTMSSKINKLYFWNMAGSGLGGILILSLMYLIPPQYLLLPLLLLALVASFFSVIDIDAIEKKLIIKRSYIIAITSVFIVSVAAFLLFGKIKVSEFKSISYVHKYPDSELVHHSYSPMGEVNVFSSSLFHSAPGLSDIAIIDLNEIPKQDFWGLYTDGDGPFQIMGKLVQSGAAYMDYLPLAAPYILYKKPEVLLIDLNSGISAQLALYKEANHITIVEPNYELVKLLRDDPTISTYNDQLFERPDISLNIGNPRAYCIAHPATKDLIEISLIDSIGSHTSMGHSIGENFTYTTEAIDDYMKALKPDGVLSLTVWNGLIPPRNVPKILTTIITSLREQGVQNPGEHLFAFDLHRSTATVLVKRSPFTQAEITKLLTFIENRAFDLIYYSGMQPNPRSYENIMSSYRNFFTNEVVAENALLEEFKSSDFYYYLIRDMLEGREKELYRNYIFDITPMTDDRPYYSVYLKPGKLFYYLDQMKDVMEEWGLLLVLGVLIQSIIFGALIIIFPLVGRFKELLDNKGYAAKVITYFSCLGLGYMLMEMFLIQRLVFFLSDPIYSTSIVLTSMLIISGIGSIVSARFKVSGKVTVIIAVAGITLSALFYLFGLSPLLKATLQQSFFIRILLSILVVAPGAFFLGMPFPNGLKIVSTHKPELLPWSWGMNGALSVTGAVLGRLISITFGFAAVLILTVCVYITAGFTFPSPGKRK